MVENPWTRLCMRNGNGGRGMVDGHGHGNNTTNTHTDTRSQRRVRGKTVGAQRLTTLGALLLAGAAKSFGKLLCDHPFAALVLLQRTAVALLVGFRSGCSRVFAIGRHDVDFLESSLWEGMRVSVFLLAHLKKIDGFSAIDTHSRTRRYSSFSRVLLQIQNIDTVS